MFYCIVILCLVQGLRADMVGSNDTCPDVKVLTPFKLDEFMGTWYQLAYYSMYKKEIFCGQVRLFETSDDYEKMMITSTRYEIATGKKEVFYLNLYYTGPEDKIEGRFYFRHNGTEGGVSQRFWVLNTDYVNYAIAWGCRYTKQHNFSIRRMWVLVRDPKPSDEVMVKINSTLADIDVDKTHLKRTIDIDCKKND